MKTKVETMITIKTTLTLSLNKRFAHLCVGV